MLLCANQCYSAPIKDSDFCLACNRDLWQDVASKAGCSYLLVLKDKEDGIIYPVYVPQGKDVGQIERSFISESKCVVMEIIRL